MIYDEALEVKVAGLSFLAFSRFELLGLDHGHPTKWGFPVILLLDEPLS